jgi:hypothetical protein
MEVKKYFLVIRKPKVKVYIKRNNVINNNKALKKVLKVKNWQIFFIQNFLNINKLSTG